MADWLKILISALLGVVTGIASGILLEPMKFSVQRYFAAKRAEQGILSELANIYEMFCMDVETKEEVVLQKCFSADMADTFEFYYTNHREAVYRIKWRGGIRPIYSFYTEIRSRVVTGQITAKDGCNLLQECFSWCFKTGLLDRGEIMRRVDAYGKFNARIRVASSQ